MHPPLYIQSSRHEVPFDIDPAADLAAASITITYLFNRFLS